MHRQRRRHCRALSPAAALAPLPPPGRADTGSILLFLASTTLLSAVFWALMIRASQSHVDRRDYLVGLMWAPAVAAWFVVRLRKIDLRSLGLSSTGGRAMLLGYALPLCYAAVAYGLVWASGVGSFPDPAAIATLSARLGWRLPDVAFVTSYFLLVATTGIVPALARALGEEIGWRGFLGPALIGRMGFSRGVLATGLIWTAWHVPLLVYADYHGAAPRWFALSCFTVLVVALSVVLAWLR